ncbi:MAG: hypothetical protein ABIR70_06650 [Bryobacteraceae bacterium]
MNRKIVVLNVLLLALLVWLGMQLRASWLEAKAREAAVLARGAKPGQQVAPPAVPGVDPAVPAEYIDVAQRMLFSKDRDPNILIDPPAPPPPPPPEKPVPPLPSYYGQMSIGEPVIILSTDRNPQKSYHVGDKVGEFTVAAFDRDSVTLEWNDKTLVHTVKELTPKEAERPVQVAAAPAAAPAANVARSISKMGDNTPKSDPAMGPLNGRFATCLPEDTSPDGTIRNGYRKKLVPGMMGVTCMWEPI